MLRNLLYHTAVDLASRPKIPRDSGYASSPNDPFEAAFQFHFSADAQSHHHPGLQHQYQPTYPRMTSQTKLSRPQLRHQQSMPLLPYTYQHFNSYQGLDARLSRLSVDAGINTLTGYRDMDSTLLAAHDNTSTTQAERFHLFASQHTSPVRAAEHAAAGRLTPPPLIREAAFTELESPPCLAAELLDSPTRTSRGRRRGRSTHPDVERRYRDNLVAQFGNLASAIPFIPTQQPKRAGKSPKPSKAEILLAAFDHIRQLEHEVAQLRIVVGCDLSPKRKIPS
ncbi:hypothetical protein E4T50_16835 [Aureobasidium sp. EXF-12298]|nr:hypothetical protein E4T50_16835 [Aureobasidium sp. EXF-12298]